MVLIFALVKAKYNMRICHIGNIKSKMLKNSYFKKHDTINRNECIHPEYKKRFFLVV